MVAEWRILCLYKFDFFGRICIKLCNKCVNKEKRIVERPSKEQLLKELKESNFVQVGKKYGVSDNSIRKWCKSYNLPTHISEIKELEV